MGMLPEFNVWGDYVLKTGANAGGARHVDWGSLRTRSWERWCREHANHHRVNYLEDWRRSS